MDGRCRTTKANGERCRGAATGLNGYCWAHDPKNAEQRRRTASKAGRSKPSKEIRDLKNRLEDLAEDVLAGRCDRGDAAVASQLYNYALRAVSVALKAREQEELEGRLEELETILAQKRDAG